MVAGVYRASPQMVESPVKVLRCDMNRKSLPLAVALVLVFGLRAVAAAEQAAGPTGLTGFPAASASAASKGTTGETADCPINARQRSARLGLSHTL